MKICETKVKLRILEYLGIYLLLSFTSFLITRVFVEMAWF